MTTTVFELFAEILEYPEERPGCAVDRCVSDLGPEYSEVAVLLRSFQAAVESMELGQLQEIYTATFDMLPDCSLNLGYQLFGDDWRRSTFLADLIDRYRGCGLPTGKELPDHLCLILRFLAKQEEGSGRERMIDECLFPALTSLLNGIDKRDNPYGTALEALLIWLRRLTVKRAVAAEPQSPWS